MGPDKGKLIGEVKNGKTKETTTAKTKPTSAVKEIAQHLTQAE